MIVEVGAMDRASPYSSSLFRALLLNFIVTTRIIRIPISMFSYRCFETRSFFAKETKIVLEEEEEVILFEDLIFMIFCIARFFFFFFYDLLYIMFDSIKLNIIKLSVLVQITNIT